jgi:hypothetical protein
LLLRLRRSRNRPALLDRAEADAVGLAQGTVHGTGFGDAHLGAMNERRDVGGIGISVADEALHLAPLP